MVMGSKLGGGQKDEKRREIGRGKAGAREADPTCRAHSCAGESGGVRYHVRHH